MLSKEQEQKRWRWVVLSACFLSTMASAPLIYSFGAFVLPWMEAFSASGAAISLVTSCGSAIAGIAGPFGSLLVQRWGIRTTHVIGGIFMAAGYGTTSFATSLFHVFLTYSLIGGIGTACSIASFVNAVSEHFHDHQGIAFAIVSCGYGVGGLIFPLIFQVLIEKYDWRGAMLVCSGVLANVIVCGLLTYPVFAAPPWPCLCSCSRRGERKDRLTNEEGVAAPHNGKNVLLTSSAYDEDARSCTRKDPTPATGENRSSDDFGVNNCIEGGRPRLESVAKSGTSDEYVAKPPFSDVAKEVLGSWSFYFVALHNLLDNVALMSVLGLTPIRAVYDLSMDNYQATILVSIFGIAQLVFRILFGTMTELKWIKPTTIYFVAHFFGGAATLLSVFARSFLTQVIYCTVVTAALGSMAFYPVVIYQIYGRKLFNVAVGFLAIMHGIGAMTGPVIGGYIFDVTGTAQYSFVFAGISLTVSVSVLLIGSFVTKEIKRLRHYFILSAVLQATDSGRQDEGVALRSDMPKLCSWKMKKISCRQTNARVRSVG